MDRKKATAKMAMTRRSVIAFLLLQDVEPWLFLLTRLRRIIGKQAMVAAGGLGCQRQSGVTWMGLDARAMMYGAYPLQVRRYSGQRDYAWHRGAVWQLSARLTLIVASTRGTAWRVVSCSVFSRNADPGVPVLDALSLAGANTGAACISRAGPLVDLPADRRHLHALHAGVAAWAAGWTRLRIEWGWPLPG